MPPAICTPRRSIRKTTVEQYINLKNYPYLSEGLTVDKGIVYAGIGAGLSAYDLKKEK